MRGSVLQEEEDFSPVWLAGALLEAPEALVEKHLWDEVREKWFANEVFDSLDSVEDRLVEALVSLERNQDLVASITGFDWLINCQLTAT